MNSGGAAQNNRIFFLKRFQFVVLWNWVSVFNGRNVSACCAQIPLFGTLVSTRVS